MRKTNFRLKHVTTFAPHTVGITYTDNSVITVDLKPLIESLAVFALLDNPKELASATITDFGFTLEWSCGASLDSDKLFEMSLEQTGMVSNAAFRRWQDANQLSLTQAAQAIGMTRRTISQYRTGKRPVPRTVSLACKGWEVEQLGMFSTSDSIPSA